MKAVEIRELQVAVKQEIIAMRGYLIVGDDQSLQDYTNAVSNYKEAYDALLSKFKFQKPLKC